MIMNGMYRRIHLISFDATRPRNSHSGMLLDLSFRFAPFFFLFDCRLHSSLTDGVDLMALQADKLLTVAEICCKYFRD